MALLSEKPTMKERILETTDRLFYLRGIRAVGVDAIAAEIGISKRTLYNHFPSKDELIAAYLARRFRQVPASVCRAAAARALEADSPEEVAAILREAAQGHVDKRLLGA